MPAPAAGAFATAFATFLLLRQAHPYGDGPNLARLAESPPVAGRNALYPTVSWLTARAGRAWGGLTSADALGVLSGLAGAAAVGLLVATLLRHGLPRRHALAAGLVAATAPVVVFFSTTVEVHAFQLAGAAAGFLLATHARERSRAAAVALVALGAALAIATHATSALVVPAIVATACGPRGGSGLGRRTAVLLGVALPVAGLGLLALGAARDPSARQLGPLHLVGLAHSAVTRGLFGPAETAEFLLHEFALPLGALLALLPAAFLLRPARRAAALGVLALAPFLIVLPQTGVRESGGYVVATVPALGLAVGALLAAMPRRAALVLALAAATGNAVGAGALIERNREEPPAPLFAERTARVVPPRGVLLVTSQARLHALNRLRRRYVVRPVAWEILTRPRRQRAEYVRTLRVQVGESLLAGLTVAVDRDVLADPAFAPLTAPPAIVRDPGGDAPVVLVELQR
jgi:4-amino-4-deoxy-L-arabinose transferase-like glycosyltransferase